MEVLLVMLLIPPLGGGLLLSEWQSRSASGRRERTVWRYVLCGLGALLVPIGLGMMAFAVSAFQIPGLFEVLLLVARLLLSAAVVYAGVTAVRVGLCADELDLSLAGLGRRNRLADSMRLTAWVLVGFPLFWVVCVLLLICSPLLYLFAIVTSTRRANQARLLWLLAIAVENDMPLAEEVDAFADSFWGGYRRALYRLATHLRQGVLLSDALETYPRLVPRSIVVSIRAGEETGSLGRVLRQSATGLTTAMQRTHLDGSLVSITLYYWWVLTGYSVILGFICYWIIPKFKEIFNDFGVDLPQPTVTLISFADLFAANFWLLIPVVGLPLSVVLLLTYIHLVGWGNLNWPWLLRWFPRRDAPEVLHNLALAVSAEHSLPETLRIMGGRHYRRDLGEKLQRISAAIDGGAEGWRALRDEGFVSRTEAEAVAAAARAGHLAFALDALALSMERLRRHRVLWWIEACKPVIVIAMALLVAGFCIAMFLPIVTLITQI